MKKMPNSIRKHIRKEKARIRREVLDLKDQEKQIQDLYSKFTRLNAASRQFRKRRNYLTGLTKKKLPETRSRVES